MKYDIILNDPPWSYKAVKPVSMGGMVYNTIADERMAQIPFADIATDNALMFCWMTMPKLEEQLYIMRQWGFHPVACAFVWIKLNRNSNGAVTFYEECSDSSDTTNTIIVDAHNGFYSGLGSYTCGNVEIVYIGRRSKVRNNIKRSDKSVKQLLFAPLMEHSRKPDEVHRRIDRMYDPGQYSRIEFFARRKPYAPWWDATGLDLTGEDVFDFIEQHKDRDETVRTEIMARNAA